MAMEDEDILKLYFAREEKAIEKTSEKYGSYCRTIAENILESREDADECVNDTWLKAWMTIPPERPRFLKTFLARITRNLSFDRYRKKNAEKRGGGQMLEVLDELAECVPGGTEPEKEWDRKELLAAIESFLDTLSLEDQALFVRRYWYAESVADLALRFSVSRGALSVRLYRLRERLREHLMRSGLMI